MNLNQKKRSGWNNNPSGKKKCLLVMRNTFMLLLAGTLHVSAINSTAYSQTARISVEVNNTTVGDVLHEIEEHSEFYFTYNSSVVNTKRVVSIDMKNRQINEILDELFAGENIGYSINDKHIVLYKKDAASIPVVQQGTKRITGTVVDASGVPVIGANVMVKGTSNGTITDMDGKFTLEVSDGAVLEVSYIGYLSQTIKASGKSISIILKEDTQKLDEVVVVGYGTQKKGELTSSISTVKSDSFVKGAVQDAAQLLQGKVAGLGVVLPNGDPTASSQIMLRGVGTLMSGTSPLVIIDGVPGDMSTVATEDIESIDIVKDGSAAAIYGTRGNNGVIFITTKKAKGDMPLSVDVQTYVTTQQIKKRLEMLSASEYRELAEKGVMGAYDYGYETDWQDEIFRTPISWVTNANFKGGTYNTNYIANINYKSLQGIIKESDNNVLTSRLEVNHNMWDGLLKFNFNILGKEQKYRSYASGFNGEVYRNALTSIPTERPKDDEGNWIEHTEINYYSNPLALIYESNGETKITNLRTFGSVTITPIKQLFVKALASRNAKSMSRGYSESKNHISAIRSNRNGYATKAGSNTLDQLLEITTQYKEQIGKHSITGLFGYSFQNTIYESYSMSNWDFTSDQYTYNNMGAGEALKRGEATQGSLKQEHSLVGFFGRANYSFDNKYLISASLRREGSSKFGADHKWGNFPAFSLGWNITEEDFMDNFNDYISSLKVRVGFGITGTIPTNPYISLSTLSTIDMFYTGKDWLNIIKPASNSNPDLRWEKKEEWNVGLDFSFFDSRIFGSIDLYKRTTKDMLWNYQVSQPPYLYSSIVANAGSMENKGLELGLTFLPIQSKNFNWSTTFNYSTNKNKLLSLSNELFQLKSGYIDAGSTGEPIQQSTHRLYEGGKVGDFFGYKSVGIDENGRWLIEGKDGEIKPILEQQPDDKQVIGNGLPKHFLSWMNTLTYKRFSMSVNMRGAFGFDILNMPRLFYDNPVFLSRGNLLNTAFLPKMDGRPLSSQQELQYVSYYIENGNYWKIDNISLGYTFDLDNKYLKHINIYLSGNNLFTITSYKGIDPEVNTVGLNPGCDERTRYPSTRTFTIGTILSF